MPEWKRGDIQAIGVVAKLLIVGGAVTICAAFMDFDLAAIKRGLPGTLISGPVLTLLIGSVVFLLGFTIAIWLWRVRRRTGISTQPFDRREHREN